MPAALAYARRHADPAVLQRESCNDIVQSVCRDLWVRRDEFEWRGLPAFRKLLFQQVLRKLIDRKLYNQREKRDLRREAQVASATETPPIQRLAATTTSPSQAAVRSEDLLRFQRCYEQLPPQYQLVICRFKLEGRTHAEIAVEMDREPGAVRVLLHRALIKLGLLMDTDARESSS